MTNSTVRFHLVDGRIDATFSEPLTGRQFAELYKFVIASTTIREFGDAIARAAEKWGLTVQVEPGPSKRRSW